MNLIQANIRLLALLEELKTEIPLLEDLEWVYLKQYMTYLQDPSAGSNQTAREAFAKLCCDTDGLYKPYMLQKIKVRLLLNEKDILIEYCKNIRSLA